MNTNASLALLLQLAQVALPIVVVSATAWIGGHVKNTKDYHRAQAIALIARGAIAAVRANNPSNSYAQLVEQAVNQIVGGINPPTTNREVLKRAVMGELATLGVVPTPR